MLNPRIVDTLETWLDLERSGAPDLRAEPALASVFQFVPLATPSAELMERIVSDVRRSRDAFSRSWVRASIAASLAFLTLARDPPTFPSRFVTALKERVVDERGEIPDVLAAIVGRGAKSADQHGLVRVGW